MIAAQMPSHVPDSHVFTMGSVHGPHQEWFSNVVNAAVAHEIAVAAAPSRDLERSLGSSRFRCRILCTAYLRSHKKMRYRQSPQNAGTRYIESSFGKALPRLK